MKYVKIQYNLIVLWNVYIILDSMFDVLKDGSVCSLFCIFLCHHPTFVSSETITNLKLNCVSTEKH